MRWVDRAAKAITTLDPILASDEAIPILHVSFGYKTLGNSERDGRLTVIAELARFGGLPLDLQEQVSDGPGILVPQLDEAVDAGLHAARRVENVAHRMDDPVDVGHSPLPDDVAAADLHASSCGSIAFPISSAPAQTSLSLTNMRVSTAIP